MSARDRLSLFPSTSNLILMKQRIASAQMGLNLLKRKRDALEIHLRHLSSEVSQEREKLEVVMKDAIFSMAKANFLGTDFKPVSVVNPDLADVYLCVKDTKVIGLTVPTLELVMQPTTAMSFTGLARGGQQVQIIRDKFQEALKVIVALASLEYSVSVIEKGVKQNNRRVNGLEFVLLPRYQNTMAFIRDELDELGREEFYRLKRSQAKQIKKKAEFVKQLRKRQEETDVTGIDHDFVDTHRDTLIERTLAAKPRLSVLGPRKTIHKVHSKVVIVATEEAKPLTFDEPLKKTPPKKPPPKKTVSIKTQEVVTSSSSESSES